MPTFAVLKKVALYNRAESLYDRAEPLYDHAEPLYDHAEPLYNRGEPLYDYAETLYENPKPWDFVGIKYRAPVPARCLKEAVFPGMPIVAFPLNLCFWCSFGVVF